MSELENAEPRVCAVVLNWNRPDDTLECLDSLLPLIHSRQLALVVCDNASSDDSVDRIRRWAGRHCRLETVSGVPLPSVGVPGMDWVFLLVQTGANRGYAGGNNVGIHCALKRKQFEFLWILNNDTILHEHALDMLLQCARRNSDVGAFGSTVVDFFARDFVQMAGGCRYHPLTTVMRSTYGGRSLSEVLAADPNVRLDYISGAAMFCRADMFRKVGLFDERFFLYYEEMDLSRRMHPLGFSLHWCKDSIVYHKGGVSTGGRSSAKRRESWLSEYHENLSTLLYTRKHHPRLLPVAAGLRFFGKFIVYLYRGHLRLLPTLVAAYRDALTGKRSVTSGADLEPTILEIGSSAQGFGTD